jgi:hypothetical protein
LVYPGSWRNKYTKGRKIVWNRGFHNKERLRKFYIINRKEGVIQKHRKGVVIQKHRKEGVIQKNRKEGVIRKTERKAALYLRAERASKLNPCTS